MLDAGAGRPDGQQVVTAHRRVDRDPSAARLPFSTRCTSAPFTCTSALLPTVPVIRTLRTPARRPERPAQQHARAGTPSGCTRSALFHKQVPPAHVGPSPTTAEG
jgi:hypothetical protein